MNFILPSVTPTNTASVTPTIQVTKTPTPSVTPTKRNVNIPTATPTPTKKNIISVSNTPTATPTKTKIRLPHPSNTPTGTPTRTPTNTPTSTKKLFEFTPTPSNTSSNQVTKTPTPSITSSKKNVFLNTSTPTPTKKNIISVSNTPTATPTKTKGFLPNPPVTPTHTPTRTPTHTATSTKKVLNPLPTPSITSTKKNIVLPTETPTPTSTKYKILPNTSPTPTNTRTPTHTNPNFGRKKVVTPQMYGAVGDGVTNDFDAFCLMFLDNTLNRDSVTYYLASNTYNIDGITNKNFGYLRDILVYPYMIGVGIDETSQYYKNISIIGNGATIQTNQRTYGKWHGPPILNLFLDCKNFYLSGVNFSRLERGNYDHSGGGGLLFNLAYSSTKIDNVTIENCYFTNCHPSIDFNGGFSKIISTNDLSNPRWHQTDAISSVNIKNCNFSYPYGSNTPNPNGGAVCIYINERIHTVNIDKCYFNGLDSANALLVPNGVPKDGLVQGPARYLNVSDTFIKNYWVEGITGHIGQGFAYITQSLVIPELGETTTLTIEGGGFMFTPGQIFFIGSDHRTDNRSCYARIERVLSENQLEISVVDSPSNAPAGTVIYNGLFLVQPKFDIENSRTTVLRLTSDSDGVITRFNGYNYNGGTSITPNATSIYLYPSPSIRVDDRNCTIKDCVINAGGILLTSGYGQRTEFEFIKLNDSLIENCYFEVIPKNGDSYTIFQNSPNVEAFTCFVIWPGYRGVSAINCHIHSLCSTPQIMMDLIGPYSIIDGCFFDVDVKNPSIELIGDVDYNGAPTTGKYCAMGIMVGNNGAKYYENLNNISSYTLSSIPIVRNCTFKNINKGIAASIYNGRGLINIENNNTFINCNIPTDTYVVSPSGIGQIYWSTGDQQY